jgi:uncharacterized protein (TIGR03083 family)
VPTVHDWLDAVRSSHRRLRSLLEPLSAARVAGPSYHDWSIAQVASHLGSQAEIFELFLDAGLDGSAPPGGEVVSAIWSRWDGLDLTEQQRQSLVADERLVDRLEAVTAAQRTSFALAVFGSPVDFPGLLAMRLAEHAVHTWDIAVALDADATVAPDATALLVDGLPVVAARAGRAPHGLDRTVLVTRAPDRVFSLTATEGEVALEPAEDPGVDPLTLPAEALIRLVYGRLDAEHTPAGVDAGAVAALRPVFPGF